MNAKDTVHVLATRAELVRAAAQEFVGALANALAAKRGTVDLAISGGLVSEAVLPAADRLRDRVEWARVRVWWVDERFVPAHDARRNDESAIRALFARVPDARLRPMPADAGQGILAARDSYATAWSSEMGEAPLDLLLVGMGPDGHVASLFPHHATLEAREPVLAEIDSPKPPPWRITLSLPVLRAARRTMIVTAGAAKAAALARALREHPPVAPGDVPVSSLRGPSTSWWIDREAAALLRPRP